MSDAHAESDAELVAVQQSVLATVDHACGNIFQRLYHLLRTARSAGGERVVPALEDSVRELQGLLELFLDYVAPMQIETRPVRCSDLVTSWRRHLEPEIGSAAVRVTDEVGLAATVAVDPARLGRVFQLMARSLGAAHVKADALDCACGLSHDRSHFEISLTLPPASGADAELRWALVEKLVDLQGGELCPTASACGSQWTLRLPVVGA